MYKQLTVATTIMFLMLGVLWAGAAQDAKPTDAEKEAYYNDLNAQIDAEKEAYYEALEAEKEAYYDTQKLNTKSQPTHHFELLKDNDIDPAYRVQRPEVVRNLESKYGVGVDVIGSNPENYQQPEKREPGPSVAVPKERLDALESDKTFISRGRNIDPAYRVQRPEVVRNLESKYGVDVLGTSLQERKASGYEMPIYHFEARDDADPAQKVRLPEDVTPPAGSRDCYNWNDAWFYLWFGQADHGSASLFSLDAGTYSLESVSITDYSNTYLGLTEATATVNVDIANADGSTASTIATGTLVTDGSTGTLDFTGTSFELTATTFIKVSVYPSTNVGDYTGDGVDDYAPLLLSEDGTAGDGFCGTDSSGVYTAGVYDYDIGICYSYTGPAGPANDDCANAEAVTGPYPVEITSTSADATIDCEGFLNWNAVWYELELPYFSNNVDVNIQADSAISNGGIVLMDDCACDDYIASSGYAFDPAGGNLNVWFDGVSGPDNDGTILFPLYIVDQQGFTVTFNVTSPPNPAVFFSEYAEGSSNHKYLEIYNGTGDAVSLNDYVILGNYNGNPYSETFTFATDATLASGDVYVLANDAADSSILAHADEVFAYGDPWYITSFNGDDVRALSHLAGSGDTVIIDIIGTLEGGDPGSGWAVAGVDDATKDHTLVRKGSVATGNDGDWAMSAGTGADDSEWIVFDQNEWSYVGSHPHCFEPNVLIVNMYDSYGDGWNGNVLTIGDQTFELLSGDFATGEACLTYGDFAVTCDGGSWQSEVSWEILDEAGNLLLAGGAPFSGTLSLDAPYTLTLSTASWASEISWAITAAGDSGNVIYTGSGYSNNTDYEFGFDLADGDYEFHMYDSYGDSWNGATYSIDDAAGHNISSGGLTEYTNYGMDPFSVPWMAPLYPYYFTLNTASWASEISWAVTAAGDSGNVIYTGAGYSNDSTYADTFDLADGDYEFHMYDSYGDSWNGATYVILDGSGMTVSAGGLTDYTDYGMNPFSVPFVFPYNLTLTTASYGSEVSWAITAAGDSANAIYSGSGYSSNTEYVIGLELDDGDYEFHMYDSYGDSWNGATYSIDDAAGNNIVSGGLTDYTNYGMDPFSVPWIPPITGDSCEDAFSYGVVNGEPQVGATTESGDADWYSFDVDVDYDNVSISLCESGFDTQLEVWGACDDAAYLGYNDDFCGLQSQVDFTDVAAGTYHAKVFGYGSSFGDYILTITGWDNPAVPALTATAGMGQIVLDWEPVPTRGMYSPQVDINGTNSSKQEEKQENYIQYDPSDYPAPRQGGDTIGDATAIDALPFDAAGTTAGYIDDYDEECPYTGSTSPDVVYSYAPTADMFVDISICESAYDTKLYVYENDAGNNIACNDDACSNSNGDAFRSSLEQVSLTAGNTYYIVVDGYSGNSGDYNISVTEAETPPEAPANDECANAEAVTGPYPIEIASSSAGATVDCEGFLNWNAVWYELELPYASNSVDVFIQADGAISNGGIVLMDDCACDDYIASTGFDWDPAGGWLNVWFDGVSGADNDGTILFPLYIVEQQGFTVTFDVTEVYSPSFNVYRDGGDTPIAEGVEGTTYTDGDLTGGVEYCYTVTQIMPDETESGHSNEACAIPEVGAELCPPSDLMAEGGDSEVLLSWNAPGMLGVMPPIDRVGLDPPVTQKIHLPKGVTRPDNSRECYNWNDAWFYLWFGGEWGPTSVFPFEPGSYTLESVAISDYSGTYIGLTEATALVSIGVVDYAGTVETIATGTLMTDGAYGMIEFDGTGFELDTASWIGVSISPQTNVGDINGDGADDFAPFLLSDDGLSPSGWCGWDSAGWLAWDVYDFDIALCASEGGGGGNECGTFSNYNVYMGDELVGQTDIEEFVVEGLTNDMEYCFNVTAVYAEGESEASNDACATPMAPSMGVSHDAMADTLMPGESSDHAFSIENTGGLPFSYDVMVLGGADVLVSEDFEGGGVPDGWMMYTNSALGWIITMDGSSTYWTVPPGDGYYAVSNDDLANDDGSVDYLVMPGQDFTDLGGAELSFDSFYSGTYSQTAHVEVSTDAGYSWTEVALLEPNDAWVNVMVDLSGFAGESSVHIAFHSNDNGAWASGWAIDNVELSGGGGVDWLLLSSNYGELEPGEADEIVVTMNAGDMEEGTYDAEIGVYTFFGEHMIAMQMVVDDGVGVTDGGAIPDVFALHQNFPNPFNPLTAISYDVPEFADVRIDIYNLLGQNVRTLVTGEHEPGFYQATWNGKNDQGALVTTGVYIYLITARSNATGEVAFTKTRKLVLMK